MGLRFFISQEALDRYAESEGATLESDQLLLPRYRLDAAVEPAVYFVREVEDKPDPHGIVGKVRTVEALALAGADNFRGSVVWGDNAYDVVDGFVGTADDAWRWPIPGEPAAPLPLANDEPVRTRKPSSPGFRPPAPPPDEEAAVVASGRAMKAKTGTRPSVRPPGPPPPEAAEERVAGESVATKRHPPVLTSSLPSSESAEARGAGDASAAKRRPSMRPPARPPSEASTDAVGRTDVSATRRPSVKLPAGAMRRPSQPPTAEAAEAAESLERILLETVKPKRDKSR